jgi:hypothetical protein
MKRACGAETANITACSAIEQPSQPGWPNCRVVWIEYRYRRSKRPGVSRHRAPTGGIARIIWTTGCAVVASANAKIDDGLGAKIRFSFSPISPAIACVPQESRPPAGEASPMRRRSQHDRCKTTHSLSKRGSLLDAARLLGHQLTVAWSCPSSPGQIAATLCSVYGRDLLYAWIIS